jgi:hypothetical protein
MVHGDVDPDWSERLLVQQEVMQEAARATEKSREHNRERLNAKANAKDLEVGDQVMIVGHARVPLTAKWDHHYTVTRVRGKVVTVVHNPTGRVSRWNRNKVKLVDPEISWEGVSDRPRAKRPVVHNAPIVPEPVEIPAPPLQQLVPLKPERAAPAPFQFAEKPKSHPQVPGPSIAPTTQGDASFKQHLRMRLQRKHFRQPYPSKRPPRLTETWSIVPATPEPMQTNPPRGGRKRTLALDAEEAKRCRDEVLAYCWQSPLLWPKPRSQLNH